MKRGYITVFFALVFMVLMSLIISLFIGIQINAYKLKAESVYSVASNSVLGEYHKELLEKYDLFYVDTSYKKGVPDYHQVENRLWDYIEKNWNVSPASVEINQIVLATDNGGVPYRKQISSYMKDKIGMTYVKELSDLFTTASKEGFLENNSKTHNSWEKRWQDALVKKQEIPENTWRKIEKFCPIETAYSARESFVLNQVVEDKTNVSKKSVNVTDCVSNRELIVGTGCEEELNLMDKIYFITYLVEKFSCYTQVDAEGVLDYELEYLLGDGGSDYENLSIVVDKLLAIRETMNVTYLLSDNEKMSLIKEISSALSALIASPELSPVFEVLLIGLWSYAESVSDIKILLRGGQVPLVKTKENWATDLESSFGLEMTIKSLDEQESGMNYTQYLEMLLLVADNAKITFRSMDLIEMNIREIAGNENFRMDGLAEDFLANLVFEIPQFGSYHIVRRFGYVM